MVVRDCSEEVKTGQYHWRRNKFKSGGGAFCRAPPLFGSESTISRFGERFRDGQYSLVSFLFAVFSTHGAPCLDIRKSWGHVPHGVGVTDDTL